MNGLREVLTERGPFVDVTFKCRECDSVLYDMQDYRKKENLMNEALIMHRCEMHTRRTGHTEIGGSVEPIDVLKTIDATITINDSTNRNP